MVDDGAQGEWTVDLAPDESGVLLNFTHMGSEGVEAFSTGMPRENAIAFAAAVLNMALEIEP